MARLSASNQVDDDDDEGQTDEDDQGGHHLVPPRSANKQQAQRHVGLRQRTQEPTTVAGAAHLAIMPLRMRPLTLSSESTFRICRVGKMG